MIIGLANGDSLVPVPEIDRIGDQMDSPDTPVPRIAFLGFCERAETLTEGHVVFWKQNLLGLSNMRAFYVFPANLRGLTFVIAMYRPSAGESFKLIFRSSTGAPPFDITFNIQGFTQAGTEPDSKIVETEHMTGILSQGWQLAAITLGTNALVLAEGNYDIFLTESNGEQYVGYVTLVQAIVPPYTPEQINAIKSDPLARKFVRLQYSCKSCPDQFKAYAGVERSESLEQQGFQWNLDIQQETFVCSCGNTFLSLLSIKMGLHGLLQRNIDPQTSQKFSSVRLYEQTTLEQFCRELLALIDAPSKEEELQNFLESHPVFFHIFVPKKILFKPRILTKHVADFAVLNTRDELLLIEIERPGIPLLKRDGDITAGLGHALFQVRTWMQDVNDHRAAILDAWDIEIREVARVRGVVVAGRRPKDEKMLRLLRSVSSTDTELFTYDDLLNSITELIRHIANV